MSAERKPAKQNPPPKQSWRYRLGLGLFVASFPLFYGTIIVVPFLGLSTARSALVMSVLLALFYAMWLLSLPLLGREGFDALKAKYRGWWRLWKRRDAGKGK